MPLNDMDVYRREAHKFRVRKFNSSCGGARAWKMAGRHRPVYFWNDASLSSPMSQYINVLLNI